MITEQRLRFEANHKVPEGAIYNPEINQYIWAHTQGRLPEYQTGPCEYNARWFGYQSALEDRQGEAVATSSCAAQERLSELMAIAEKLPASEQQTNVMIAADKLRREIAILDEAFTTSKKLHIHCVSTLADYRTSPQPAQPDQWNAAIEAAAEVPRKKKLSAEILMQHDGNTKDDLVNLKAEAWTLGVVETDILALRKGA